MFEILFKCPGVLRRHKEGPLAAERETYLTQQATQGDLIWYSLVVVLLSTNKAQQVYLQFKKYIDRVAGSVLGALGLKLAIDRA